MGEINMKPLWIILTLAIIGFVFPPIWIALVIYLIWVATLRRPVRETVIKEYTSEHIAKAESLFLIPVPYNDVRMFALQNGGRSIIQEVSGAGSISMHLLIHGCQRVIIFNESYRPPGTWVRIADD